MKYLKVSLITVFVLTLFIAAAGCGQKVDKTDSDDVTMAKADIPMTAEDSLKAKNFPIRNEDNPFVTIVTDFGKMTLELYRDVAPAHADSFVARTNEGFYTGLLFHRIVKNFMIQGGDPKGNGTGNAGYFLVQEFNDIPHQDGTLSMARGQSPNSASCQFFICLARNQSTAYLDGKYTVFGQLIHGYDVLHTIGDLQVVKSPSGEVSKPAEDVYMRKVYLSDSEGNPL